MSIGLWVYQACKFINKLRLRYQRLLFLKITDKKKRENYPRPVNPKSVLLISVNTRFGDALYTLGLAKVIKSSGSFVAIAAFPEFLNNFNNQDYVDAFFNLKNVESLKETVKYKFDAIVDLEYVNAKHWKYRRRLLSFLHAFSITTSDLCRSLNFYNDYLPFRNFSHISLRYACIYNYLFSRKINKVSPFIRVDTSIVHDVKNNINNKNFVYLNCRAGDRDRCFSNEQALAFLEMIQNSGNFQIIINPPNNFPTQTLSPNIKILPRISFFQLAAMVSMMTFVVTPDTSVTHLAAVYNIPTFVVFPPNDRDFYHEYSASEVWGAMSDHSFTVKSDDPGLVIDPYGFGYPNKKTKPISSVDTSFLRNCFINYINSSQINNHEKII
jgi:ADP-heptose:LPS heptosyltransferase